VLRYTWVGSHFNQRLIYIRNQMDREMGIFALDPTKNTQHYPFAIHESIHTNSLQSKISISNFELT
jgi:hypothetical protein